MRSLVLLVAFALCLLSQGVSGDNCHTPTLDIGDEAGLAADICAINAALDDSSPPDYVTAEAFYRTGFESRAVTLRNIATGDAIEGEYAETSSNLFGDDAWMDNILQEAFAGEGSFNNDVKRVQVIKKLLQSAVLGHRMFHHLEASVTAAEDGDTDLAVEHLELAMADFFGLESGCAIFGNGQSRGIEFGTMDQGTSAANYDLVESFADGVAAIEAEPIDVESLEAAYAVIRTNFITIYLQSSLKYASNIRDDVDPSQAQGEGFGYYHAIAAQVHAVDEEAHETIFSAFDLSARPSAERATAATEAITSVLDDFGISEEIFGVFDRDAPDSYVPPVEVECEAVNPFVDVTVDVVDADR